MRYTNAKVYGDDFQFHNGSFEVENGRFTKVSPEPMKDAIDLQGKLVLPGLIDIHTHGNMGHDFSDGDYEGLNVMAAYYLSCGVTSFAATSMTLPLEQLEKAYATGVQLAAHSPERRARLVGIHMEGPFFSEKKKGAQNADFLREPDFESFQNLYDMSNGLLRLVDVAPELPGAIAFIQKASALCTVSIAHTNATYEQAAAGYAAGATQLTHMYNAMPGIHHREPGVIPAAVEKGDVRAEIICDGYHIHPAAIRLAFSMFGAERMILISDSGPGAGLPDGTEFAFGGQMAHLDKGVARLADDTIACSATNLWQCLTNTVEYGIPKEDAIRAATYNPACALGVQDRVGSITPGKYADFIVCDDTFKQKRVFLGGEEVDNKEGV